MSPNDNSPTSARLSDKEIAALYERVWKTTAYYTLKKQTDEIVRSAHINKSAEASDKEPKR